MQCKMKEYFFSFYTAEVQAYLINHSDIMLTDHTDRTDFLARAACFSTTEMTELTDFVEHCMLTSPLARCCV
ncbi:hypothetical protein, partial [Prevotellamassilia timonensis]|uniref:hypothetical protein n=1 Tax=Prevotellamassilia timonensis TaxID=1852370 RepID=UPI00308026E7